MRTVLDKILFFSGAELYEGGCSDPRTDPVGSVDLKGQGGGRKGRIKEDSFLWSSWTQQPKEIIQTPHSSNRKQTSNATTSNTQYLTVMQSLISDVQMWDLGTDCELSGSRKVEWEWGKLCADLVPLHRPTVCKNPCDTVIGTIKPEYCWSQQVQHQRVSANGQHLCWLGF